MHKTSSIRNSIGIIISSFIPLPKKFLLSGFQRALDEKKSLFREFTVKSPYVSVKDIFCIRIKRTTDCYRKISLNNLELRVKNTNPHETINLRIYPVHSWRCVPVARLWNERDTTLG
jgi:hypothetical protein